MSHLLGVDGVVLAADVVLPLGTYHLARLVLRAFVASVSFSVSVYEHPDMLYFRCTTQTAGLVCIDASMPKLAAQNICQEESLLAECMSGLVCGCCKAYA